MNYKINQKTFKSTFVVFWTCVRFWVASKNKIKNFQFPQPEVKLRVWY